MFVIRLVMSLFLLSAVSAWAQESVSKAVGKRGVYLADAGGRPIKSLESGSSLWVGARGLRPNTMYEFRLSLDGNPASTLERAVSFMRVRTGSGGEIPPQVLWYQGGVVGCSESGRSAEVSLAAHRFRHFAEARKALGNRMAIVSVHAVADDPSGRTPPMKLRVGEAESLVRTRIRPRTSPMVYVSDQSGCLWNSRETGSEDIYVTGRHFRPGESVEISVTPNQRSWSVGDSIHDVTGVGSAAAPKRVTAGRDGSFTVKVWERANQRRGAYDVVAHRLDRRVVDRRVGARDIISYLAETGFIFYLRYPVGGPTMDIAGRPLAGAPYFQFADSFAETGDVVWGAVDPTYVPAGHTGGSFAAYYVVPHRDVNGWNPAAGGATNLVDVSGGIEISPVKAGCINGTDIPIWSLNLVPGQYDVVVDFGGTAATSPATYSTDGNYDAAVDFLDGADQVGFVIAKDPYELGTVPIGRSSYSQDDYFPVLGGATNVDLRAVVRYPATAAGVDTPVATGTHPLFVIEHGNHAFCRVLTDGRTYYQGLANAMAGIITWAQFQALQYTHANCPDRTKNHEGYMHLLDILASHGIIAVSIDAYDLTGPVPSWIQERSDLILKHIELWSHMNNAATFPTYPDLQGGRFVGHVDMTKIGVSGHSRGGEASVGAYMRNTTFNITAVSSIAPVDNLGYTLPDVPYFVILPAADGDVSNLSGMRIYDRAGSGLSPADSTMKSGNDVYGASHNFFNTVWAADKDDSWAGRDDYIPAAEQQKIGEAYLAAFALAYLNNETVYLDMLRGKLTFPSLGGRKIYHYHHEKQHAKVDSGSGAGGTAGPATVVANVTNPSVHATQARRIAWSSSAATYTYTLPAAQRNVSAFEVLAFRAAQTNAATNPASGGQDFQVELVEGAHVRAFYSSRFGPIPKPYNRLGTYQNVMTTIRIPLQSFIMNNAGTDLTNIDTVRFRFTNPSQGEIYVDDVEFSR